MSRAARAAEAVAASVDAFGQSPARALLTLATEAPVALPLLAAAPRSPCSFRRAALAYRALSVARRVQRILPAVRRIFWPAQLLWVVGAFLSVRWHDQLARALSAEVDRAWREAVQSLSGAPLQARPCDSTRVRERVDQLARAHHAPDTAEAVSASSSLVALAASGLTRFEQVPLDSPKLEPERLLVSDVLLASAVTEAAVLGPSEVARFGRLLTALSTHAELSGELDERALEAFAAEARS